MKKYTIEAKNVKVNKEYIDSYTNWLEVPTEKLIAMTKDGTHIVHMPRCYGKDVRFLMLARERNTPILTIGPHAKERKQRLIEIRDELELGNIEIYTQEELEGS